MMPVMLNGAQPVGWRAEYANALGCRNLTLVDNIRQNNFPERLYRYRSLNSGAQLARVLDEIQKKTLYLASRTQLNDPLEMLAYGTSNEGNPDKEFLSDCPRIAAFTDTLGNMPMLAHYADSHKGICFEFDAEEIRNSHHFQCFHPVNYYDDTTPPFVFCEDGRYEGQFVDEYIMLHKRDSWSYENEWRYALCMCPYVDKKDTDPFLQKALRENTGLPIKFFHPKAIYLGCHIDSAVAQVIEEVAVPLGIDTYDMRIGQRSGEPF